MAKCPNPECKEELKQTLRDLQENLYGEGPNGTDGVYGALNKKIGYKAGLIFVSLIVGVVGFFIATDLIHEGRITRNEVSIQKNTETIIKLCQDIEELKKISAVDTKKILDAISGVNSKLENRSIDRGK